MTPTFANIAVSMYIKNESWMMIVPIIEKIYYLDLFIVALSLVGYLKLLLTNKKKEPIKTPWELLEDKFYGTVIKIIGCLWTFKFLVFICGNFYYMAIF